MCDDYLQMVERKISWCSKLDKNLFANHNCWLSFNYFLFQRLGSDARMWIAIRLNYKLPKIPGSFHALRLLLVIIIRILFVASCVTLLVSRFVAYLWILSREWYTFQNNDLYHCPFKDVLFKVFFNFHRQHLLPLLFRPPCLAPGALAHGERGLLRTPLVARRASYWLRRL